MKRERAQVLLRLLPQRQRESRVVSTCKQLLRWWTLARQRQALARLDERMLKDIGISRGDAMAESARPFWDDPLKRS